MILWLFSSNTFGILICLCCPRGPLLYFSFKFLTNVYPNRTQELGEKIFPGQFSLGEKIFPGQYLESPSVAIAEFICDFCHPATN